MNAQQYQAELAANPSPEQLTELHQRMLLSLEMHETLQEDAACLLSWLESVFVDDIEYTLARLASMEQPLPLHKWDPQTWRKMENLRLSIRKLVQTMSALPPRPYDPIRGLLTDPRIGKADAAQSPMFPNFPQKRRS